jgi:hypothetical protein
MPPGTPVRVRVRSPQGSSLIAVIRVVGTIERPFDILRWSRNPACW